MSILAPQPFHFLLPQHHRRSSGRVLKMTPVSTAHDRRTTRHVVQHVGNGHHRGTHAFPLRHRLQPGPALLVQGTRPTRRPTPSIRHGATQRPLPQSGPGTHFRVSMAQRPVLLAPVRRALPHGACGHRQRALRGAVGRRGPIVLHRAGMDFDQSCNGKIRSAPSFDFPRQDQAMHVFDDRGHVGKTHGVVPVQQIHVQIRSAQSSQGFVQIFFQGRQFQSC